MLYLVGQDFFVVLLLMLLDLDDISELVGWDCRCSCCTVGGEEGSLGRLFLVAASNEGFQVREMLRTDFGFDDDDGAVGVVLDCDVAVVRVATLDGAVSMQTGPAIEAQMCPSWTCVPGPAA